MPGYIITPLYFKGNSSGVRINEIFRAWNKNFKRKSKERKRNNPLQSSQESGEVTVLIVFLKFFLMLVNF